MKKPLYSFCLTISDEMREQGAKVSKLKKFDKTTEYLVFTTAHAQEMCLHSKFTNIKCSVTQEWQLSLVYVS